LFDNHGGNGGGTSAAQLWRTFYQSQGSSLNVIFEKGFAEEAWDYVGVAYALRAWGFQQTTDYFGELPFYDAWQVTQTSVSAKYRYDKQETVYKGIDSLCRLALHYLNLPVTKNNNLNRADRVYNGDKSKWIKFTYGILARLYNRTTNKSTYSADSVMKFCDLAFTSNSDNFLVPFTATRNDDTNPHGPARNNFGNRRASRFITQLLDGTIFTGSTVPANRDPRISRMLSSSFDTTSITSTMPTANGGYRFCLLQANGVGDPEVSATGGTTPGTPAFRRRVSLLWGDSSVTNTSVNVFGARLGKYVFQNGASYPVMTYHELKFIQAEAAFRKGDKATALAAYQAAINAHMDFVNFYATTANGVSSISPAQRTAYFATAAYKTTAATLTLTDIMLQKYIGDFGWNFTESWADMRRFHYFDLDPDTNDQVYKTFTIPIYSSNNQGPKPAYRFSPTNFSEFDWNIDEIRKLGGLNVDYHTYEMWFSQP
jgi:Starch-binding associating with outer membrane